MKTHLRANLLLLAFTLIVCCVLYPLVLLAVGQTIFPTAANGNIVKSADGKERGSHLIAQPFADNAYFWPRPSAASFNATASGASNYGANNPKLRDRIAQQLGPMVLYKKDSGSLGSDPEKPRTPQMDIEAWFAAKPDRVSDWANEFQTAAGNWAKTDFANDTYGLPGKYILDWASAHPEIVEKWKKDNSSKTDEPKPEDLVANFFESFAAVHPGKWPGIVKTTQADKSEVKKIEPVSSDSAIADNTPGICGNFFEMWLRDPANKDRAADLEPVAADMVMASGSGLDPHITLRNALSIYQLNRVASKRTSRGQSEGKVREDIAALARQLSFVPLGGLIGEPLVNVLELNRELDARFPAPPATP